jgi:CBS domain containing-hemolysin-like protein
MVDRILGEDHGVSNLMSRSRMKKMFEIYEKEQKLNCDERKILQSTLDLSTKTLKEVMTPIDKVFMLDIKSNLDEALKRQIYEKGFSWIPIYDGSKEKIVGVLSMRDMILANT